MIGRCVSCRATGIDVMSSVYRMLSSKVLIRALRRNHHRSIALAQHIFRREQPIFDCRGQAALEQDRLAGFADLAEQVEILHVAGADLEHVGVALDQLDLPGVHDFATDRHAQRIAAVSMPLQSLFTQTLESTGWFAA